MWKRIVWDLICVGAFFIAPWWVVFVLCLGGIVLFRWYGEAIVFGVLYDTLFGGGFSHWYVHLLHTFIFTTPLLVAEFIKKHINV